MFATCNLPGSTHFHYIRGTREECEQWLNKIKAKNPIQIWEGGRIVPEKEARSWRYKDGNPVFRELGYKRSVIWSNV